MPGPISALSPMATGADAQLCPLSAELLARSLVQQKGGTLPVSSCPGSVRS